MTAWLSMRELGMLKLPPRNQQGLGAADKEEPASPGLSPQHRLFYVGVCGRAWAGGARGRAGGEEP